jgi:hypothetical protein
VHARMNEAQRRCAQESCFGTARRRKCSESFGARACLFAVPQQQGQQESKQPAAQINKAIIGTLSGSALRVEHAACPVHSHGRERTMHASLARSTRLGRGGTGYMVHREARTRKGTEVLGASGCTRHQRTSAGQRYSQGSHPPPARFNSHSTSQKSDDVSRANWPQQFSEFA